MPLRDIQNMTPAEQQAYMEELLEEARRGLGSQTEVSVKLTGLDLAFLASAAQLVYEKTWGAVPWDPTGIPKMETMCIFLSLRGMGQERLERLIKHLMESSPEFQEYLARARQDAAAKAGMGPLM